MISGLTTINDKGPENFCRIYMLLGIVRVDIDLGAPGAGGNKYLEVLRSCGPSPRMPRSEDLEAKFESTSSRGPH